MEQQNKVPVYKKKWFIVAGSIVALIIIGSIASGNKVEETTSTSVAPVAVAAKSYQEVFSFSGNGAKKSEPFNITGDRFKIVYDCSGDPNLTLCQAFVYKVGSSFPQGVMNSPKAVKDETVIYTSTYGKGEYYIDSNVIGNFKMTVYDYK